MDIVFATCGMYSKKDTIYNDEMSFMDVLTDCINKPVLVLEMVCYRNHLTWYKILYKNQIGYTTFREIKKL